MRLFLGLILFLAPLAAQEAAKPAETPQAEAPKAEAPKAEAPKTEAAKEEAAPPAAEPAPPDNAVEEERFISGSVDVGYRWITGPKGDFNTYRSVVNLGEGPRVFNFDLAIQDPSKHFWHNLTILGSNWGGDPYNTLKVIAEKQRYYRFTADYRNIAYYDFLPSFANPTVQQGVLRNQRSYDSQRRMSDIYLELLPTRTIVPFFSYNRNSNFGNGITPVVTGSSNEYPVRTNIDDHTNSYRGGARIELSRNHFLLEVGGTSFEDNQSVFSTESSLGNRTTPIFGQRLSLTNALQSYGITGDSRFARVLWTSNILKWVDIYAQFLYSQPKTYVDYAETATGNFALLSAARFYNTSSLLGTGEASMPRTSGVLGVEFHPMQRWRILYNSSYDRFHNASNILLTEQLFFAASPEQLRETLSADRLVVNYHQERLDAVVDITKKFTLRGGYRYEWGDATSRAGFLGPASGYEYPSLKRHVGLAGGTYRFGSKFTLSSDFEASNGLKTYFRTSLQDYRKFRSVARYQVLPSLLLTANFNILNNANPAPTVNYDFESSQQGAGIFWNPKGGNRISVLAEYSRVRLRSDISYLEPQTLTRAQSLYRDNGHTGVAAINLTPFKAGNLTPSISLGGSFFVSGGTRPINYYQPLGRLLLPVNRHASWYSEWRWYGLSQDYFVYEGFRSHQFTTGFRFML